MIRNLIILDKNGQPLLAENFGECHSLPTETNMADVLSGFISALYSMAKHLSGQEVNEVNFGSLRLFITTRNEFVFVVAADDNMDDQNKTKLNKFAELFVEMHNDQIIANQTIDQALKQEFPQVLILQGIIQDNCGDYEGCIDCPNSNKSLPVKDLTQVLQNK
jgi:hypothetical protein